MSDDSFDWHTFGEEIARLRTRKGWSRSALLRKLARVQNYDGYLSGETSLKRLESGEVIKLPHNLVLSLAKALDCTDSETARLLFLSGKNILIDEDWSQHPLAEACNFVMFTTSMQIKSILKTIQSNKDVKHLSEEDKVIILYEIMTTIVNEELKKRGI